MREREGGARRETCHGDIHVNHNESLSCRLFTQCSRISVLHGTASWVSDVRPHHGTLRCSEGIWIHPPGIEASSGPLERCLCTIFDGPVSHSLPTARKLSILNHRTRRSGSPAPHVAVACCTRVNLRRPTRRVLCVLLGSGQQVSLLRLCGYRHMM